jgi:hypothetical protein
LMAIIDMTFPLQRDQWMDRIGSVGSLFAELVDDVVG